MSKLTSSILGSSAAAVLAAGTALAVPGTADAAARPFSYPTAVIKLHQGAVREPGTAAMTVTVSACVTGLVASAESSAGVTATVKDTVTLKPGRVVTLRFPFRAGHPAGVYVAGDMFARLCGQHGYTPVTAALGHAFPVWKVTR